MQQSPVHQKPVGPIDPDQHFNHDRNRVGKKLSKVWKIFFNQDLPKSTSIKACSK
jgi:hypothetical protein